MAKQIETTINFENGSIVWGFDNGKSITIGLDILADEIVKMAALHGLKQKVGDAGAISKDEHGRSATTQTKFEAMNEVASRLMMATTVEDWNKKRGTGDGTVKGGLLFEALCRLYPAKTADEIREWLSGMDKKTQAALRANQKIAPVIDEIRAERILNGESDIDTDDLLSGLED